MSISGPGRLTADVGGNIDSGITLIGSKDANLNIDGADVTASSNVYGVQLQAGEGYVATATINDGNLTASGSTVGIYYSRPFGGTTGGPSSLTVSGNAVVDTEGSIKGILNSSLNSFQVGADGESGGIVWDGNTGTVYGDVTLQDDLTINEGETLTIGTDASLTIPDGKTLTNNGTITNDGTINIQNGGTVSGGTPTGGTIVSAPTITKQPESQTVAENAAATFTVEATGGNLSYQWQQSTNGTNWTDISSATSNTYTTEATTDMNGRQYRCKVSNNADSVTSEPAILTVNQHEHEWGEPAWAWGEDGTTATATFTCAECGETRTVDATVTPTATTAPTCTEDGVTEYTATATFNGTTYTATKNITIPATGHEWGEDGHCTICDTIKPGFMPEIIQGDEATWTKGDGQPLSFTSNAAYADFQEARVDGQTLDPVHYTVERGSTIVTLKAAYLESLDPGGHTLDIVSSTGTATATFTITAKETQQPADGTQTPTDTPADTDRSPAKSAGDGGQLSRGGSDIMPAVATFAILMAAGLVLGTFVLRRGRR